MGTAIPTDIRLFFFFSSRRRHTRSKRDWSSDVCSSDLQYSGNVTWVKRNHSIRFGIDVSQQHMNHQEVTPTAFNFSGGVTGLYCPSTTSLGCQNGSPATGEFNSFADFLLGLPQSASSSELTVNWVTLRTWQFAPYVSDTW